MMGRSSEDVMKINDKVQTDILAAMNARDGHRLTTLRMVKAALEDNTIKKREALTDAEERQILTTLIAQRAESIESFPRPELAVIDRWEIGVIEGCLLQDSDDEKVRKLVRGAIAHLQRDAGGVRPGPKDHETALQVARQWIRAAGLRDDVQLVSEMVKTELEK